MMHEMYGQRENIDVVFLGASHAYRSFDTRILDEQLGMNTFNMGSSSQSVKDSYFLLREMYSHHLPRYCILEMSWARYNIYDFSSNATSSYILYDYFRPSVNKLYYFFSAFNEQTAINAVLPFRRYPITAPSKYLENIKAKMTKEYFGCSYSVAAYDNEHYAGKGYVYRNKGFSRGNVGKVEPYTWSNLNINNEAVYYFDKIYKLCEENGTELILVTAPVPLASVAAVGNYQEAHEFLDSLAEKYGLVHYDFNLAKKALFENRDEYFYDSGHMSGLGANVFSNKVAGILLSHIKDIDDLNEFFYSDTNELMASVDYVLNVWAESREGKLNAYSFHGTDVKPEYEFLYRTKESDKYAVIKAYSSIDHIYFDLIPADAYEVRVNARAGGSSGAFEQYYIYRLDN